MYNVLWWRGSREVFFHLPARLPHLQLAESWHHWLVRDKAWSACPQKHPEHRANHASNHHTVGYHLICSAFFRRICSDRLSLLCSLTYLPDKFTFLMQIVVHLLGLTNNIHINTLGNNNQTCLIQGGCSPISNMSFLIAALNKYLKSCNFCAYTNCHNY